MREAFQYKYLIVLYCLTNLRLYHFYLSRGEVRPTACPSFSSRVECLLFFVHNADLFFQGEPTGGPHFHATP